MHYTVKAYKVLRLQMFLLVLSTPWHPLAAAGCPEAPKIDGGQNCCLGELSVVPLFSASIKTVALASVLRGTAMY
jgi:hypothetical protein